MKKIFLFVIGFLMYQNSIAQFKAQHHFSLHYQQHRFLDVAEKSELQFRYDFRPFAVWSLHASVSNGTYGNTQYDDGFLHLQRTRGFALGSNIYPVTWGIGQSAFKLEPYIGLNYEMAFMSGNRPSFIPAKFETVQFAGGLYLRMKKYTSVQLGYNQQMSLAEWMKDSRFLSVGIAYQFHHKQEEQQHMEYNALTDEFMESVQAKEKLAREKLKEEQDHEQMVQSYELMLKDAAKREKINQALIRELKRKNEHLSTNNVELLVQINRLKLEIEQMNNMNRLKTDLEDYHLVQNLGNPFIEINSEGGQHLVLASHTSAEELKNLSSKFLGDYEDNYLLQNQNGQFVLMVRLDLNKDELFYEYSQLRKNFPNLFQLMGNEG